MLTAKALAQAVKPAAPSLTAGQSPFDRWHRGRPPLFEEVNSVIDEAFAADE